MSSHGCKASIILSTYNWPEALRLILESLNEQALLEFEVVIADDGSTGETKTTIDNFKQIAKFPIKHVWQPDEGFRPPSIRNKAALSAENDFLIFLDGDCVVFPSFVANHLKLAERGWFNVGKRTFLHKGLTDEIIRHHKPIYRWSRVHWLARAALVQCNRGPQFIELPLGILRKRNPVSWRKAQTCNLGVWKDDFFAVDGFDERYDDLGGSDKDFIVRLIRSGIFRKSGEHSLLVLHLWHPRNRISSDLEKKKRQYQAEVLSGDCIKSVKGVSLHLT